MKSCVLNMTVCEKWWRSYANLVKDSDSLIYITSLTPFTVSLLAICWLVFSLLIYVTNFGQLPERAPLFPWQHRDGQEGHVRDSLHKVLVPECSFDRHGFSANIISIPIGLEIYLSTYPKNKFNCSLLNFSFDISSFHFCWMRLI